jgi:signal transduction histidine kinase
LELNAAPVLSTSLGGDSTTAPRAIPSLLLVLRWAGCAAAAAVWARPGSDHSTVRGIVLVGAAVAATAVVTLAWDALPHDVHGVDVALVMDLTLAAALVAAGGFDAFLVYALSPVLVAGLRPGIAAVRREKHLRESVQTENRELTQRNRELQTFEEIASTMQTTMDVTEVQERVVVGITEWLGYPRAVLGLSDATESHLTGWLGSARGKRSAAVDHLFALTLGEDDGAVTDALSRTGVTMLARADARSASDRRLIAAFGEDATHVMVVPVRCRGHLVGCLLVQALPGRTAVTRDTAQVLERLATQAGLALANVRLCVERTQKLTLEQERMRIAADMHDSIAQALFGIVYQLNACARQLPGGVANPELQRQLGDLGDVAQKALQQVRTTIFDIWPADLTADVLRAELHGVVRSLAPSLHLEVDISSELDGVDTDVRKTVFRITHEALVNVAKHAGATRAWVAVTAARDSVAVEVRDDGVGIPEVAPASPSASLGVRGMVERAESLGGTLVLERCPDGGTRVVAHLPRLLCRVV